MNTEIANVPTIDIPSVAPAGAHRKLADALVDLGLPEAAATALSRVVVNPTEMRRKLATPTVEQTTGARIYTVPTQAWSPLLIVHPDNKRETVNRPLPIGGGELPYPPLPELTSSGFQPLLRLEAESHEQLSVALKGAESYLKFVNKLDDEIQDEGVLRPLTIVPIEATFANGDEDVSFASTADGSSRTAAAHRIVGISAAEALFQYVADDRTFRRFVAGLAARAADGERSEALWRIANVLIVPADVVIRIEAKGDDGNAAQAIRSFVGLLHVQPPTPWSPGAQLDAQGDEVAGDLRSVGILNETEYRYMVGLVRFEEAEAAGLPRHGDQRAAWILEQFVRHEDEVKHAIRRINNLSRVRGVRIANVATELAIRSFRGDADHSNPTEASKSRVGLQLAYQMREIWEESWAASGRSPEELREAALAQVNGRVLGPAQVELAILGGFELARAKVLTQYSLRKDVVVPNFASPGVILRTLASDAWGIQVLFQAVKDGRQGESKFVRFDREGNIERVGGMPATMDADWLRATFDPAARPTALPTETSVSPEEAYALRQEQIAATVHVLDGQLATMREIRNGVGAPLVQIVGWRSDEVRPLTRKLARFIEDLRRYEFAYQIANQIDPTADTRLAEEPAEYEEWE